MKPSARTSLIWAPRILSILYASFISLFALDAFSPNRGLGENLVAFSIHMIPTAVVLVVLALAWRWSWVGGALYVVAGILYIVMARGRFPFAAYLAISGPLFITGALFFMAWVYRKELSTGMAQHT